MSRSVHSTIVLALLLFLGAAAFVLAGCGSARPAAQPLLVAPTGVPVERSFPVPGTEFAVQVVFDTTTSADRFAAEAQSLIAGAVSAWPSPGRGGLDLTMNLLTSRSWDAGSQLLAARLYGVPEAPVRRASLARPEPINEAACAANSFSRSRCLSEAAAKYNADLEAALADEDRALSEHKRDLQTFNAILLERKASADMLAERIRSLTLARETAGSDIMGALLRGAETLRASTAPKKMLLLQSDMVMFGSQQPGALDLHGIRVVVFLFDCPQGIDCGEHRRSTEAFLLTAGAISVTWLDPGATRLSTSILEVAR